MNVNSNYFDATSFSNTQLLLEIWKGLLKRLTSTFYAYNAHGSPAESEVYSDCGLNIKRAMEKIQKEVLLV